MKFLRPRTIIIFALAIVSGAVLLSTSQNVQRAQESVRALQEMNDREEEKVRMLSAEWQALNRPERLERLADEYLDLVPPTPEQIAGENNQLPSPSTQEVDNSTQSMQKQDVSTGQKNVNTLINELEGEQ